MLVFIAFFITFASSQECSELKGDIEEDKILNFENSPYCVHESFYVAKDVNFSIQPGVEIRICPKCSIIVYGKLNAQGEQGKKIVFTSFEKLEDRSMNWGFIQFLAPPVSEKTLIRDVVFEYGGFFGKIEGDYYEETRGMVIVSQENVEFSRVVFSSSKHIGLSRTRPHIMETKGAIGNVFYFPGSGVTIRNCKFLENGFCGYYFQGEGGSIVDSEFSRNGLICNQEDFKPSIMSIPYHRDEFCHFPYECREPRIAPARMCYAVSGHGSSGSGGITEIEKSAFSENVGSLFLKTDNFTRVTDNTFKNNGFFNKKDLPQFYLIFSDSKFIFEKNVVQDNTGGKSLFFFRGFFLGGSGGEVSENLFERNVGNFILSGYPIIPFRKNVFESNGYIFEECGLFGTVERLPAPNYIIQGTQTFEAFEDNVLIGNHGCSTCSLMVLPAFREIWDDYDRKVRIDFKNNHFANPMFGSEIRTTEMSASYPNVTCSDNTLYIENNFWGYSKPEQVRKRIHDFRNQGNLNLAKYDPFLQDSDKVKMSCELCTSPRSNCVFSPESGIYSCECDDGLGPPGICDSFDCSEMNDCSSHGECVARNECKCDPEFSGKKCDQDSISCYGIEREYTNVCGGHGECVLENKCICRENYFGGDCELTSCFGILSTDFESSCSGHGKCVDFEICECDEYYEGERCDEISEDGKELESSSGVLIVITLLFIPAVICVGCGCICLIVLLIPILCFLSVFIMVFSRYRESENQKNGERVIVFDRLENEMEEINERTDSDDAEEMSEPEKGMEIETYDSGSISKQKVEMNRDEYSY